MPSNSCHGKVLTCGFFRIFISITKTIIDLLYDFVKCLGESQGKYTIFVQLMLRMTTKNEEKGPRITLIFADKTRFIGGNLR
jgi:hypothetical protein